MPHNQSDPLIQHISIFVHDTFCNLHVHALSIVLTLLQPDSIVYLDYYFNTIGLCDEHDLAFPEHFPHVLAFAVDPARCRCLLLRRIASWLCSDT